MFGKIENGVLIKAPKSVIVKDVEITIVDENDVETTVVEDRRIINPSDDILLSLGWMQVVETEQPTVEDGHQAFPHYEEQNGNIVRVWSIEKLPDPEPTSEDRISALEEELMAAKILLGVE